MKLYIILFILYICTGLLACTKPKPTLESCMDDVYSRALRYGVVVPSYEILKACHEASNDSDVVMRDSLEAALK